MAIRKGFQTSDSYLSQKIRGSIYNRLSRDRKYGFIIESISGIFYFLIGTGSFIVRVFLRKKLGERSFGVFSIFFAYLFIRLFYLYKYLNIAQCSEVLKLNVLLDVALSCDHLLTKITYIILFPLVLILSPFIPGLRFPLKTSTSELSFSVFNLESPNSFIGAFSTLFLILAIFRFLNVIYRSFRKIKWYSYHRGKSNVFFWLVGMRFGKFKLKDFHVWMIIEPMFLILIAILFKISGDNLMHQLLIICSVCLVIEEYLSYKNERAIFLDMIDQELYGQYFTDEIQNFIRDNETIRGNNKIDESDFETEIND